MQQKINRFRFWFFLKRVGVVSKSKLFNYLFGSVYIWLSDSKTFDELFCLRFDIFQDRGGIPDSKDDEEQF